MLNVLIGGLDQAVLFSFVGIGLVLIYRQSGVLNFAHGAVMTVSGYAMYAALGRGAPYPVAAATAVAAGIVVNLAVELLIVRNLSHASELTIAIATLGAALLITGGVTAVWGRSLVALPPPIPANRTVPMGAVAVGGSAILALIVLLVIVGLLHLLLSRTRLGLQMRASSEGPFTSELLGVNVALVRSTGWAIAGGLAGVAAIFLFPQNYLDPDFALTFMITAFAAIVLGGLESLFGVMIGALIFGELTSVFAFKVTGQLSAVLALATILVFLVAFPHGLLGRRLARVPEPAVGGRPLPGALRLRIGLRWAGSLVARLEAHSAQAVIGVFVVLVGVALLLPQAIPDFTLFTVATAIAIAIAVLSQNLVAGYSGQISLGQSGFVALGGVAFALGLLRLHLDLLTSLVVAMVVAGVAGLVLSPVIIRLSGVYLAVLTLAFALAVPELIGYPKSLTGGALGLQLDPQSLFGLQLKGVLPPYLFVVTLATVVFVLAHLLVRSPTGRLWIAVRDSEAAAASLGVNVGARKVEAFVVSAMLAGLAGGLLTLLVSFIAPDSYTLWLSIYLVVAVIVGGSGSLLGSLLGALFIVMLPVQFAKFPQVPQVAFGLALVLVLPAAPEGIVPSVTRATRSLVQR